MEHGYFTAIPNIEEPIYHHPEIINIFVLSSILNCRSLENIKRVKCRFLDKLLHYEPSSTVISTEKKLYTVLLLSYNLLSQS